MPAAAPSVLVVDDDDGFRAALIALLESDGIDVVGAAANGAEAARLAKELRPDVVTMDLDMPVMDGVDATKEIAPLGIPVVVVTGSQSGERVGQAIAAGAKASLIKSEVAAALLPLVRAIHLAHAE